MTVSKIEVQILTGDKDPSKNTKIFLGFEVTGGSGSGCPAREFRLRLKNDNDSNPFRSGTTQTLIFGTPSDPAVNVRNPELNDPTGTPGIGSSLDETVISAAYIRVTPESRQSWQIMGGLDGVGLPNTFVKLTPPGVGPFFPQKDITLQEDAGEKVVF